MASPISLVKQDPRIITMTFQLALLGYTEERIARALNVHVKTVEHWKTTQPEFLDALNRGRAQANAEMAESLYMQGKGYYYYEDVVTAYKGVATVTRVQKWKPGNPWAALKFLQVRERELWRESSVIDINKRTLTMNLNANVNLDSLSDDEIALLRKIGVALPATSISSNDGPTTDAIIASDTES